MEDSCSPSPSQPTTSEANRQTSAVVDRWRQGDQQAFEVLHRRFAPLVLSRIRRHGSWTLLGPRMQIEDVAQEVWARVLRSAPAGFESRGEGSFAAFLGALTDHTVIDLVRVECAAKRGGPTTDLPLQTDWDRRLQEPGHGVESPTSHARRSELEELAARELSDRELAAWEMVELRGFRADEAGLAMDCSGSAVRGLLSRARARLVQALQRGAGERR